MQGQGFDSSSSIFLHSFLCFFAEHVNSFDSQVIKACVSGALKSGLIPSWVKPMTSNWFSQLPCLTLNIKG